jgi:hypothetical protein
VLQAALVFCGADGASPSASATQSPNSSVCNFCTNPRDASVSMPAATGQWRSTLLPRSCSPGPEFKIIYKITSDLLITPRIAPEINAIFACECVFARILQ